MFNEELYIPRAAIIKDIKELAPATKLFRLIFKNSQTDSVFSQEHDYKPGQFIQVSLLGAGEVPISITSSPLEKGFMDICVKKVGKVTEAIHNLRAGDELGIRGPYGNYFDVDKLKGKDLVFIGGGIGLAPLRSLINFTIANKSDFDKVTLLYGARTPEDLIFKDELKKWAEADLIEVGITVDTKTGSWRGNAGVVTTLFSKFRFQPAESVAIVCGPPVMIKFAIAELAKLGFSDDAIIATLERYMKCGVGKCGHCYIGGKYVCTDGPVFSYAEIKQLG